MNSFIRCALAAASLFLVSPSFANELFQFPEGDAAWNVEVIYPEKAPPLEDQPGQCSPNPARAKTIRVTRIGAVQRAVIAWSDGKITERWMLPKLTVILESDPRNDSVVPVESGSLRNLLLEYNRSAFDWIKPQLLQNPEPVGYRDKKCFLYKGAYHAGCPVCVEAETKVAAAVDKAKYEVEIVHLGESKHHVSEAEQAGVKSVPALVLDGIPFHINFGADLSALK